MYISKFLRVRLLCLAAILATVHEASATVTLQFSLSGTARATGFSDRNGTAGVNGMRWGVIVDTSGNGFHAGPYDGGFNVNNSGFLAVNGSPTDDYYVAHSDAAVTSTSSGTNGDPGGSGTITAIANVPFGGATNITAGDAFRLVWFETNTATGSRYGVLGNTSGVANFVIPSDSSITPYTAFFAGTTADPIRPTSLTFGPVVVNSGVLAINLPAGSTLLAQEDAGTVQIPITRTGGSTGIVGFTITATPGTATPPSDYTPPAASRSLGNGVTSLNVPITILNPASTNEANESFTVSISSPTGGATLGAVTSVTVTIVDSFDTTKPMVVLTTPAAGNVILTEPTLSITGTASDNKGVGAVKVSLDGAPPVDAGLVFSNAGKNAAFALTVPAPADGPHNFSVFSVDTRGNQSTALARAITVSNRKTMTLARIVPSGSESTKDSVGTVAMTAASTAATALSPATVNSDPKSSKIVPGTAVKLTATAKTGYAFSHWDGIPAGGTTAGNVLNFAMPTGDVSVAAAFVVNPNIPPGGASNNFFGLIEPTGGAARSVATEGFVTATILPTNGGLTGKVLIADISQSFSGTVYGDGSVLFKVGTNLVPELVFGTRTMTMSYNAGAGNDQLTTTIVNSADSSTATGIVRRGIYSATNLVDATFPALINTPGTSASMHKGIFTVGFPTEVQVPTKPASEYPQGDSYCTITLANTGTVSVSGVLADGTTIMGTSALVAGNLCPIYVQLTAPGQAATVKGGAFLGTFAFDTAPSDTDVSGVDFLWFRPTVTEVGGTAAAAQATQRYTAGWPDGITVDAIGALYDKNVDVQTALALDAANPTTGNGELNFTDGKLTSSPVTVTLFNVEPGTTAGTSKVTKIPVGNASFTLVLTQSMGTMSGTFTPNWANPAVPKPAFKGILIQKGANKGGFGHFTSNAVGDLDPEVGGVTLGAQ